MDMKLLLRIAMELCPAATYTIELTEAAGSVDWLKMNRLMED